MTVACAEQGGVNLAQGVCDTPVPEAVVRAAQQALAAGENVYTRSEGLIELRRQLAAKMRRHDGLDYDAEREIVVTNGATGAFYVAALALLEPGDEVIAFEPYYGYHTNTLAAIDCAPRFVTLEPPGWAFDRAALEAACTERTRAIIVNTPGNPSGKVFSRAELELIGSFASERDLLVFTDEVYEHFVFDGVRHLSPATLPGLRERTITINALSKTFAITGWRIGWVAAPAAVVGAFAALSDLFYVCAPTPLQRGAAAGLAELPEDYYAGIGPEYQRKRDRLCDALEKAGLPPHRPTGSYFTMADVSALPGTTSDERAMWLLREVGVAFVPGSAFYDGPAGDAIGRFCFGKTDADLDEACARLGRLAGRS